MIQHKVKVFGQECKLDLKITVSGRVVYTKTSNFMLCFLNARLASILQPTLI